MITITTAAVAKLNQMIAADPDAIWVRLSVIGGGCSGFQYAMTFDVPSPLDRKVEGMLLVDPVSYMYLENLNLDYTEELLSAGFKFNNPQVKRTCGCGSSFEV